MKSVGDSHTVNHYSGQKHIVIAPQVSVSLEPQTVSVGGGESHVMQLKIPLVWTHDDGNFRLDIDLPLAGLLDVLIASPIISLHVNGETIWIDDVPHATQLTGVHVEDTPNGLHLTCTSGGAIHILACLANESEKGISTSNCQA